jgi:hypothetical protein
MKNNQLAKEGYLLENWANGAAQDARRTWSRARFALTGAMKFFDNRHRPAGRARHRPALAQGVRT